MLGGTQLTRGASLRGTTQQRRERRGRHFVPIVASTLLLVCSPMLLESSAHAERDDRPDRPEIKRQHVKRSHRSRWSSKYLQQFSRCSELHEAACTAVINTNGIPQLDLHLAYYTRGLIKRQRGELERALNDYGQAVAWAPSDMQWRMQQLFSELQAEISQKTQAEAAQPVAGSLQAPTLTTRIVNYNSTPTHRVEFDGGPDAAQCTILTPHLGTHSQNSGDYLITSPQDAGQYHLSCSMRDGTLQMLSVEGVVLAAPVAKPLAAPTVVEPATTQSIPKTEPSPSGIAITIPASVSAYANAQALLFGALLAALIAMSLLYFRLRGRIVVGTTLDEQLDAELAREFSAAGAQTATSAGEKPGAGPSGGYGFTYEVGNHYATSGPWGKTPPDNDPPNPHKTAQAIEALALAHAYFEEVEPLKDGATKDPSVALDLLSTVSLGAKQMDTAAHLDPHARYVHTFDSGEQNEFTQNQLRAMLLCQEGFLRGLDDPKRAIVSLTRAVELAPDHAVPHWLLGLFYYDLGDKHKAVSALQIAVELDPGNIGYRKDFDRAQNMSGAIKTVEQVARTGRNIRTGWHLFQFGSVICFFGGGFIALVARGSPIGEFGILLLSLGAPYILCVLGVRFLIHMFKRFLMP